MLLILLGLFSMTSAFNLTSSHTFDFRDTSYNEHLSIRYLYGKHCADSYLHFDSNIGSTAVDDFKTCLDNNYDVAEQWFTNLRYTFDKTFEQHSYEWENATLYDSEIYNRYRIYVSAQHALNLYKADLVSTSKHFADPVDDLTMTSSDYEAYVALNQSLQNIVDMKYTVGALVESFRGSIETKTTLIDKYLADSTASKNLFATFVDDYTTNVTDVLRKLCSHPTSLYTCAKGHYCTTETTSTACPAGTFLPIESMTTEDACIECPLQTYSLAGAVNCTVCASNDHMGATACHLRSLGEVIASMDTEGPITENFYIAFDMTRQYITSASTLYTLTQTAQAAATVGTLATTITGLVNAGSTVEAAYQSVLLGALQAVYGGSTYVTALQNTDSTSANIVAQTDLTKWAGPYIDGSTHFNLTLTANTWAVYYVDGTNDAAILSGTRDGKTLTGGTASTRGMIEFPVSSALAYGYPVVTKDGTPVHTYQLK